MVDHNDGELSCRTGQPQGEDNFFQAANTDTPESTTALSSFASFLRNSWFSDGREVAVLPRGFVFSWTEPSGGDDHHLFQLGYNLESAAPFVRGQPYHKATKLLDPLPNSAPQVATGEFASWKTSVVLKDNSRRRDYNFVEFVSGMGGADVEIIQPEFVILLDSYIAGIALTLGDTLGQTPPQEPVHRRWCLRRQHRPVGLALEHFSQGTKRLVSAKRALPGEHFIEHASKGPDVRALVDNVAAQLLRRHVGSRSHEYVGARRLQVCSSALTGHPLSQAENPRP
jgi:hypothetical protein